MRQLLAAVTTVAALSTLQCARPGSGGADFSPVSRVVSGKPTAVMLTSYSTTLRANGTDWTRLRVALTDSTPLMATYDSLATRYLGVSRSSP